MSLITDIKSIVLARVPNATFVLSSELKANLKSYFESGYTVDAPLVVLDNMINEQNEILQNATFNVEKRIRISFLAKDTINDSTDENVNDDIVDPLKVLARGIFGAIYRLDSVRMKNNETARFSLDPAFRIYNSVLSGCIGEARWKINEVVNICSE